MSTQAWWATKGPGDFLPVDNSVAEAARDELIAALTEIVADEWMQDRIRVAEYRGFLALADEVAIDSAVMAGDDLEAGRLIRTSTRHAMLPDARREAARRADAMDREDEADYAAMRMEH